LFVFQVIFLGTAAAVLQATEVPLFIPNLPAGRGRSVTRQTHKGISGFSIATCLLAKAGQA
jgi:hypothetical protein